MRSPSGLPIEAALPALRAALLKSSGAVLQAPPGAGKSTVVPLALLDEPWARNKRLLMLEPRRVAARAVANRMAQLLGEPIGATVGYRMRFDTQVSQATRIEVVTEGVLTRMLQRDPALEGVAAVLFDEFHERSLQADLGLALALDARAQIAPDLKLIVMSATLDTAAIASLLGDAPVVQSTGRIFPVEIRYAGSSAPILTDRNARNWADRDALERTIAALVRRVIEEERGNVLVFLPGAGEIRRVETMLSSLRGDSLAIHSLYGDLAPAEQDAALRPGSTNKRKVVLATNIAETSLTIEGVRVVIDSGLARRSMFDPSTGMSTLDLQRISRASADQRAGRAGRLAPGICYRAWSEAAQRSLVAFTSPEIVSADLAPVALDLAAWGVTDPAHLGWIDPPSRPMFESAQNLLRLLGAIGTDGRITAAGREIAGLPAHPRVARMLLEARALGAIEEGTSLAAVLSESAVMRAGEDADLHGRLELVRAIRRGGDAGQVDRGTAARVRRTASDFERGLVRGVSHSPGKDAAEDIPEGVLAAFAFPDRIGRRRDGSTNCYTLANGRGACFTGPQRLTREDLIVVLDVDDRDRDARIRLAAGLDRRALETWFGDRILEEDSVRWNTREQAVQARRVTRFGDLVIDDKPLPAIPADASVAAMLAGIRELGIDALNWTKDANDFRARVHFLGTRARDDLRPKDWPDFGSEALLESVEEWLAPYLEGITRREHLSRISVLDALRASLNWQQQQMLDERVPTHFTVPSGSNIRIDYLDEQAPSIGVRLQECFGLQTTPLIGGVPLTFRLLSPAGRPVQITRDLASFWRSGYAEVRKDLRGRYPKHSWPENPLDAQPTRRIRQPSRR